VVKVDIREYEAMAKLRLPESEQAVISELAGRLADSFKELETVDVSGSEPLFTVLDVKNVLREDVSVKMLTRDCLLANAPEQYDGFFQVPKTLE
jgi:aspartyl-tRNA(Asn)/glutamyl-tRNA(Gln) amidotransferase subunit C